MLAGIKIVEQRRSRTAYVQMAGWTRSKANANRSAGGGMRRDYESGSCCGESLVSVLSSDWVAARAG